MSKKQKAQDSAPAPTAVIDAPPAPQEEAPKSLSESLFPDLNLSAPPEEAPETPAEEPPVIPEPASDPGKEVPPPVEPPAPAQEPPVPAPADVLDFSAFQGKKVRVKVDGEEMDVPAESLIKNFQLDAHLTRKGQQLGEQRRALEELRKELIGNTAKQTDAIEEAIEDGESPQVVKRLETELENTRKQLAQISAATADIVFEKNVSRLDEQVRSELGFDDFRSYVPKIQKFIASQLADPSKPTPEEISRYDTPNFYLLKYQEMKLRDLKGQIAAPPPPAPAPPAATPPAPRLAQIVTVEPGGGALPSKVDEAREQKIQQAFSRAKQSGSTEDWAQYYALKRSA